MGLPKSSLFHWFFSVTLRLKVKTQQNKTSTSNEITSLQWHQSWSYLLLSCLCSVLLREISVLASLVYTDTYHRHSIIVAPDPAWQRKMAGGRPGWGFPLDPNTQAEAGSSSSHHICKNTSFSWRSRFYLLHHSWEDLCVYLEGISAINSSPEGQSFSLYTMGSPSLDFGRSDQERGL